MNYYIGVDIGTTSTKAVAFSGNGDVLAKASIGYEILHPHPGYSEQDPDTILEAVINCIGELSSHLPNDKAVLVSFSAAMHSLILVDENGALLTKCIIWADNRAGAIANQLRDTPEGQRFYNATGVPIHAMSPFCKLLWLKSNEAALFASASRFIGIKEYIFYRLFGKYMVDTAIASATGLLDIRTLAWHQEIIDFAGIDNQRLSPVVKTTQQEYLHANNKFYTDPRLQQIRDTAFVVGGSDGGLANLGSGAVDQNTMAITIGTSSAVRVVAHSVYTDPKMRTFCYHMANGSYIIGGASNNGAVVLQWLKETLLSITGTYDRLFELAGKIDAGSGGLIFIPYIMGERAPVWNADAKGVFFGMDITHSQAHVIRAAMEGVVYCVYSIGKILMETRTITEIHATGGFTQSSLWLQMLADMFNCKVMVSGAVESSAFGAVKIGMESLGLESEWIPRMTDTYQPNAVHHQRYMQQFEKFDRIYQLLKNEMTPTPISTDKS